MWLLYVRNCGLTFAILVTWEIVVQVIPVPPHYVSFMERAVRNSKVLVSWRPWFMKM